MPNIVRVLMEKPVAYSMARTPSRTTGTVMAGMMVARRLCINRNMMTTTSAMASNNVRATEAMDFSTIGARSSAKA